MESQWRSSRLTAYSLCKTTGVAKRRVMESTREAAEKLQVILDSKVHDVG